MSTSEGATAAPRISAVVVHWRDETHLTELIDAWPKADARVELLVVDNSASLGPLPPPARLLDPGRNLGFAGGVNHGVAAARGAWILILNPDARPLPGALPALLEALEALEEETEVAGLVPALEGPQGEGQHRWQLQPLPSPLTLLLQTLFLAGARGPRQPPPAGSAVQQPAAAALLLRRKTLVELGGLDEGFYPAWFEDVDLARRLADAGQRLLYLPAVRFVHGMGGSVSQLGYGPFLWVYYRNLCRYLRRHHGMFWDIMARGTVILGMVLRLLLLPFRQPRRAANRRQAATALCAVIRGAASGWQRPREYARFVRQEKEAP